ncbi:hypothetical protein KDU71_18080 [Carboxylicivirga sediminis]|uniref:Uncharacterized protein n=1 Tax=Carboxylicivirga sediminis TaxID=2006564 RepID=A0A941F608_9BACT|nr:hypothetical protein [Carboxylicivirga sediminis]MBR8537483.1 hypothetical protein [Carboxylicivirga sediminis]
MNTVKVIFLHHSLGKIVWTGSTSKWVKAQHKLGLKTAVPKWFSKYNKTSDYKYDLEEIDFPKRDPYGWKNFPYDYYNLWINEDTKGKYPDPTLEELTANYDVVILKHCYPVSKMEGDTLADIKSNQKTLANYKLQYQALKEKFHQYPNTKFIVWTSAALNKNRTNEEEGLRTREFVEWVRDEWDTPEDNVYLWDFYELETQGGLFLKDEFAESERDSHPNTQFAQMVYPLFCRRIVDVVESNGTTTDLTGRK